MAHQQRAGELELAVLHGQDIAARIDALAELRIRVFREFPYLYEGSREYEARYLRSYVDCPRSIAVLALDGERVVGASTGLPLADETTEFTAPFREAGLPVEDYFYCAETVLLPAYRGRGWYRAFFAARELHARGLGLHHACFAAVVRPEDHPRRPADYRSLDGTWARFGYRPAPGLVAQLKWRDLDEATESPKPLQFWTRPLPPGHVVPAR